MDERTPILIGVGQVTQRDVDPAQAREPLDLMVEAAERAASDAGVRRQALADLDTVAVVNILSWQYANAPGALAQRFGARPSQLAYSTLGGNTPQWLVNETAAQIAAGRTRLALLAGAETVYTLQRARRAGVNLRWGAGDASDLPGATAVGSKRQGTNDDEMAYGLTLPTAVYPMFENGLRAHYGWSMAEHRQRIGELCARMTEVAAGNPYAWFPQARTAADIMTVTPQNRMIGFPYPKFVNAIMDVDQSAAVLMTSVATARRLGVDPSRWVYLWGCADTQDEWFVSERVNYHSSPAIRVAGERALRMAGLSIEQIDHLDLYSCFPCAVQIARDMLGIAIDDRRPLTVTGGLPYAGGPGNNYVMHSIAALADRLRAQPGSKGLVTALGWYITKHSAGVYSAEPPPRPFQREDPASYQAEIDALPHPEVVQQANGRAVIETYTVLHDREGTPMRGIIIARLEDGRRCLANGPSDAAVLAGLEENEAIGLAGHVASRDGVNVFRPG